MRIVSSWIQNDASSRARASLSLATIPVALRTPFAALGLGGFTTPSLRASSNKLDGRRGTGAISVSTGTSSSRSSTRGGGEAGFWAFFLTTGALGGIGGAVFFCGGAAGGTWAC